MALPGSSTKKANMSLDFTLSVDGDEVYSRNITHNLNKMAEAAGIYTVLWRPDENGITKAHQCIAPLREGLLDLIAHRAHYEQYNSPNGWGLYKHFVPFVTDGFMACCEHPDADVEVSR